MFGKQNGFINIPLRRRVEALALALVTIFASASVDWSSLTARAEDGKTDLLTDVSAAQITSSNSVIVVEKECDATKLTEAKPYQAVKTAYMKIKVNVQSDTEKAFPFTVDTYRYTGDDYSAGVKEESIGGGSVGGYVTNQYSDILLFDRTSSPFYLAKAEKLAVVVTFKNIPSGTTIDYMVDSAKNAAQFQTEEAAVPYDVTINGPSGYAMVAGKSVPDTIDFSSDFTVSPAYKRDIQYHLYNGTPEQYKAAVDAGASVTFADKGTDQVTIDPTGMTLKAGNSGGENSLIAYVNDASKLYLAVPIRVVSPTAYSGLTYTGSAISAPSITCGNSTTLKENTDFTASYVKKNADGTTGTAQSAAETIDAGDYTMTVIGRGTYATFSYTEDFSIAQKDISSFTPNADALKINPETMTIDSDTGVLTDADRSAKLNLGTDYELASISGDADDLKKYKVTLSGINNYQGTTSELTVSAATGFKTDISKAVKSEGGITLTPGSYVYDAKPITDPGIKLYDQTGAELKLAAGTNYTYRILDASSIPVYDSATKTESGAVNAGTYTVEVNGIGDYTGTVRTTFTIAARPLKKNNILVKVSPATLNYTGDVVVPTTVEAWFLRNDSGTLTQVPMVRDQDFEAVFPDSKDARGSAYYVSIKGKGNYTTADEYDGVLDFTGSERATTDADLIADEDKIHKDSQVTYKIIPTLDSATVVLGEDSSHMDTENPTDKSKNFASDFSTTYNGKEKKPAVQVLINNKELNASTSKPGYEVIYNTCINAGTGSLIIRGKNDYANYGDLTVTYKIARKELDSKALTLTSVATKTYSTGTAGITLNAKTDKYSVTDDGNTLTEGTDYSLSYEDNTKAGTATVTAEGQGNYTGTSSAEFKIEKKNFTNDADYTIDDIGAQRYTGSEITPDVTVRYKGSMTLEDGTDFKIKGYKNNKNKGEATVTVEGIGNYSGTLEAKFNITAKTLTDKKLTYEIGDMDEQVLLETNITGYHQEYQQGLTVPDYIVIRDSGTKLTKDVDYTIEAEANGDSVGEHTLLVKGMGNYDGSVAKLIYYVIAKDINNTKPQLVSLSADAYKALTDKNSVLTTGTDIKRYYQVQDSAGNALDAKDSSGNTSYTWTWTDPDGNALDAGKVPEVAGSGWSLVLTGEGNYRNSTKAITTDSTGRPLMVGASLDVMNAVLLAEADGSYQVPFLGDNQPVVKVQTSVLTATAAANKGVNTNIANKDGTAITESSAVSMTGPAYTAGKYDNSASGLDYTIDYVDDNGNPVTSFAVGQTFHARVTAVKGSTRFFGSHTMGYAPGATTSSSHATVVASKLSDLVTRSNITVTDPKSTQTYEKKSTDTTTTSKLSYAYTGSSITPSLTVTIVPQATEKYTDGVVFDSTKDTFAPIDLKTYGCTYETDNTDDTTVLAADVKDNGKITLIGDGTNFTNGTTDKTKRQVAYEITAHELTADDIKIDATKLNYTYDGTSHKDAITDAVSVYSMNTKLTAGTDYTLKFFKDKECKNEAKEDSTNKDFTNAGTLYAQITPVANATGKNFTIPTTGLVAETPFTIAKADLKGATIALGAPVNAADNTAAYTGSEIKPTVTVTLDGNTVTDSEYTVSYADNTDVGTAKVTVTGNGTNYSGTVSKDFYIYVDLSKLTAVGIAEGSSYILDKTGQPVSDDTTKTLLDYQNVTFKNGSSVVSIESGTNYTVSLTHQDLTTARYGLKEPGKYTVTYEGRGKEYGCTGTKSYNITIKGDLSTAEVQIKNYTDGYTYDATKHVYGPSASDLLVTLTSGYVVPSKCYKVSQGAGDTSKPKTDVSTEDPYVLLTASDSYSAYYTLSAAADASGRHIPFTIKYDLSKVTIKAKDGQTLEYNDTEDIDSKIAVYYPGVTDALDTQTYQVESARWVNAQSSNKAQLIISLLPDAGNVFSKGKASKTIDGQFKEWATPTIDSDKAKAVYNGQSHIDDFRAAVTIADSSGNPLNYGADYTITFKKGSETGSTDTSVIEADKYYAFIKGAGDYYTSTWTKLETVFEVTPKALTGMTLTPSDENAKYYTGKAPVISFTIHDDETGKDLQAGTDYELSSVVTQNSNADLWNIGTTIKYTAKGAGNYDSTTSIEYTLTIEAANISKAGVVDIPNKSVVYNGKEQKPSFIVNRVSSTGEVLTPLVRNTDYTFDDSQLSGQDFTNVGNYTYSIKGIGKYTGELNFKYEITPRDIGDAVITLDQADGVYPYANGSPVTPVVTASIILENGDAATPLDVTKDYTLAITSNTASHAADDSAAAPTVTLTGTGNYTGTAKKTFQIGSDISTATVTLSKTAQDYDPAATFRPTVKSIAVTGGETYTETSATKVSDVATVTYQTTTGTALAATEPVNAGTYQVLVTGKGPFFGSQAVNYKINPMETEKSDIKVAIVEDGSNGQQVDDDGNIYYYYSGKAIKPKVTVRYQPDPDEVGILLKEATTEDHSDGDYYLDYKENTNAGDAQILVYLRGNYSGQGTKKKTFEIRPVDITDFTLTLQKKTASYTGKAITKDFTLEGTNPAGDDFSWDSEDYTTTQLKNQGLTVTWSANIAPGTANLVVSGNGGNFTGTAAPATLTIVADLSDATITPTEVFRTGNALSPDITLHFRDSYGDDHPITTESGWFRVKSYTPDTGDWTTATKMTVTVVPTADGDSYLEGTGKYTITLSSTPTDLSIEGYNATYQYTGAKIQPSTLSVKNLPSGATVSYTETSSADGSACILPGTVTLTAKVTFKDANGNTTTTDVTEGKYGKKATFNITKRPIKACNFQGPSDTRYTGSAVTPIFSINTGAVQLRNGVDYTYTITGNTNPGTATITIRGKGNYVGVTKRTFNIFVGTPTQLAIGSRSGSTATITWKAVPHASGYRVIYTNTAGVQKKLITSTSYTLSNLKTSGSTQVTVEAYVANAAGTPLYYSNPAAVYVR